MTMINGQLSPKQNVTELLHRAGKDTMDAKQLLPLVYDELRRIAAGHMRREASGITLQPTALVHEAYIRLVGDADVEWNGRAHFFGAAAQAMRRILVDAARARGSLKRGGDRHRVELAHEPAITGISPSGVIMKDDELLALDAALAELEVESATAAEVVRLKFFAGLSSDKIADCLECSKRTVELRWKFARAWLRLNLKTGSTIQEDSNEQA